MMLQVGASYLSDLSYCGRLKEQFSFAGSLAHAVRLHGRLAHHVPQRTVSPTLIIVYGRISTSFARI